MKVRHTLSFLGILILDKLLRWTPADCLDRGRTGTTLETRFNTNRNIKTNLLGLDQTYELAFSMIDVNITTSGFHNKTSGYKNKGTPSRL